MGDLCVLGFFHGGCGIAPLTNLSNFPLLAQYMDYEQRQKFSLQAAAVTACVSGVIALIWTRASVLDEEWEMDSETTEMVQSVTNLVNLLATNMNNVMRPNHADDSKHSLDAIERLHECETDLDDDRMTALSDLFELDAVAASVYLSLKNESLRKSWIRNNLNDMGFPESESHRD